MTAATLPATAPELDDQAFPMRRRAAALSRVLDDLTIVSDAELGQLFMGHGYTLETPPGRTAARAPETLIDQLPRLFAKYAAGAALVTAQWYRELEPDLPYDPVPMYDLPAEQVLETARWAFFAPGDEPALSRMAGSGQRMIYDASRDTVVGNAAAEGVRWYRYAQADACAFCSVLATRTAGGLNMPERPGWTYQRAIGAKRVGFSESGIRGPRTKGMLYHDRCRCEAVPVRGPEWRHPPPYVELWNDQYEEARKGIEGGDELAEELGIAGQTPNIRNVSMYMRHARGAEVGGPATEPRAKIAQEERKKARAAAAGKPAAPQPAWMSMPRGTRDEIAAQFSVRTGIPVRPDRKTKVKAAFSPKDDLEMLREYCDGYADMNDKYGINDMAIRNQVSLRMGTSGRFSKDYAYAWVQPYQLRSGAGDVDMYFNRAWMSDPQGYRENHELGGVAQEWKGGGPKIPRLRRSDGTYQRSPFKSTEGTWHPARGTAVHETGHVMDAVTNWRASKQAQQVLVDRYLQLNPQIKVPVETDFPNYMKFSKAYGEYIDKRDAGFRDWLYESLPAYAFHPNGTLHEREAIAESFKTVEAIGAKRSNEPQRVLHELITREYVAAQQAAAAAA